MNPTSALFKADGIRKCFPPSTVALEGVTLECFPGEVHALLGENGAGKSTLSKIIGGLMQPDSGKMVLDGRSYHPAHRKQAEAAGIWMVTQELNLISTMTVAESLFMGRFPSRLGWIDWRKMFESATRLLERFGLADLDPATRIGELGVGRQQLVEIAAAFSSSAPVRLMILDEPTAALTDRETEILFRQIRCLQNLNGAVIYISHRLEEIKRIADRATVLRDGKWVVTRKVSDFTVSDVVEWMVGRPVAEQRFKSRYQRDRIALRVQNLSSGSKVRKVGFDLYHGEILGFAGLMGSGRTETLRALFGADQSGSGSVRFYGSSQPDGVRNPREAVRKGLALLTEDRKKEGLLMPWSVQRNISITHLDSLARWKFWIDSTKERQRSEALAGRLQLRSASLDQPVAELSGGNQQKVVLAKWLFRESRILMFDEPTRGIDVGAKFEIYKLLQSLAEQGKAILLVSSEINELFILCNRIAVMSGGELVRIFEEPEFDQQTIMRAALSRHMSPGTDSLQGERPDSSG